MAEQQKSNLLKRKAIKFKTRNGDEREIIMEPVLNLAGPEVLVCEEYCPYSKICKILPDPRKPEGSDIGEDGYDGFLNFCGDLGTGDENFDIAIANYVPAEGSLEQVFEDFPDIFNLLIEKNPVVRVNDIIDNVCKGGWCSDWTPDHCNCKSSNMSCILRSLFINSEAIKNRLALKDAPQDQEEGDKKEEEEKKEEAQG